MSQRIPNPYSPPNARLVREPEIAPELVFPRVGPEGLGGWLGIIGLGLLISPFRTVLLIVQTYVPLLRDGTFQVLASPGSAQFHPALTALIVFEALVNVFSLVFGIWLIILFFQKSRRFPKRYVILAAVSLAAILADSLALTALDIGSPWDSVTIRELLRASIGLLIWGPYMYMSTRVKNTFVQV